MSSPIRTTQKRLSYSTLELFHDCERKYQIEKLLTQGKTTEESEHLVFGKAFGVAIASYLVHQDQERAIWEGYLAYWPEIESDKKNVERYVAVVNTSFYSLDKLLEQYEVAVFLDQNGNQLPAVELSFCLELNDDYYFVGYIDVVLRNLETGRYCIVEAKHTGLMAKELDALYSNSGQALGYSIILDAIAGQELAEYDVLYFVAQLGKKISDVDFHTLTFSKDILDRLNWFLSLTLDVERIRNCVSLDAFPKRGGSCFKFNKPCFHYETCGLHSLDFYKHPVEDTVEYQFTYRLENLVADHLRRIES